MKALDLVKFAFDLGGAMSGYKTYIVAAAGAMAVTAQFLTSVVVPALDAGSVMTIASAMPDFIADVTPYLGIGTLRAGVNR